MKLLSDILYKAGIIEVIGTTNVAIADITSDSRAVTNHGLFVAIRGTRADGHLYMDEVISKGAVAIICEILPENPDPKITYVRVGDSSYALAIMASNFFDEPSQQIKLIGVTGTNGKTTSVTLLYQLFRALGHKVGLLSTIRNYVDREEIPATHTTPDPVQLNRLLRKMVDAGCTYCFMEVSSHAVVQKRIAGLNFTIAAFTNITHDHLDYHGTFDNYIKAKKGFFDDLSGDAVALINLDDPRARIMLQNTKAVKKSYGLQSAADFKCKIIEKQFTGMLLSLDGKEIWVRLIGNFNAYNILLAYSVATLLKQDKIALLTELSNLKPVEGRFQYVRSNEGVTAIVDYAHTPDALVNVLKTIRELRGKSENIITVVGCGGDRDSAKRPEMARIAAELSDKVVLTSDNPRSEDPEKILDDMRAGLTGETGKSALKITDRREAIRTAVALAKPGDIILVAGKGHEKYQEIKGVKHPFDDMKELTEIFNIQG
jgi:UDP-N-acetylmuramoyl-L-alanyl-D-glutamate--2,6-diaminopimelate ligase